MQNNRSIRRERAKVSVIGTTQMHFRNPWIIMLWSAIFPGMGHLLLTKYISGFILFVWEVFVNIKSHINLAIFHSFTGQSELAKSVLDIRWLLLYTPVYLFALWDSYRTAVDLNNNFELAAREDAEVKPFVVTPLGFNYLDKSSPWLATVWSMMSPGVGQLSIQRIMVASFIIPWWIAVVYFSKLLPAIHYTMLLQFDIVKQIADKQWILNIPSFIFFPIYDAYVNTVESNNLYEWELSKYLRSNYQNRGFEMPVKSGRKRGAAMYLVSNFEYSINIEKAITELNMKGIDKDDILAVPLDKRNENQRVFDTLHYSDKRSTLDIPIIIAALFSLFGMIYGFLLSWGPIIWALLGTGIGFGIGIIIKLLVRKHKTKKNHAKAAEVVLIISCSDQQLELVNTVLWDNGALGTSKLSLS